MHRLSPRHPPRSSRAWALAALAGCSECRELPPVLMPRVTSGVAIPAGQVPSDHALYLYSRSARGAPSELRRAILAAALEAKAALAPTARTRGGLGEVGAYASPGSRDIHFTPLAETCYQFLIFSIVDGDGGVGRPLCAVARSTDGATDDRSCNQRLVLGAQAPFCGTRKASRVTVTVTADRGQWVGIVILEVPPRATS